MGKYSSYQVVSFCHVYMSVMASSTIKNSQIPAFPLYLPDRSSCPESPQSAAFQHRQQHGVNNNKARSPVVDSQPVPGKFSYQLVWKQEVLYKKLCPLSPAGLQLSMKGTLKYKKRYLRNEIKHLK